MLTGDINLIDAFEAPARQESSPAGAVKQVMETVTNLEGSLEERMSELDVATVSGG